MNFIVSLIVTAMANPERGGRESQPLAYGVLSG